MPTVVITHAVHDVERWLAGRDERAAALPGAKNVTDLVATDGSNQSAVTFEIDDVEDLTAMLASMPPDLAAQAESHGVVVSTMTVYVQG
jgi:hypothetical protein